MSNKGRRTVFDAWGCRSETRLIGRYTWFRNCMPRLPEHLEGCMIALFKTRREARDAVKETTWASTKPKVVRVKVTVEEME